MTWTPATETVNLTVNNTPATITGVVFPLKIDTGAPKRWWDYAINNLPNYWYSQRGFHVNGVDDAFNVQSLTSGTSRYFFMGYFPEWDPGNDAFAPVFLNAAGTSLVFAYGTAPDTPDFSTTPGRVTFIQLGNYGTYPSTGPAALSRTLLYNSSGWYFVQTGATTYDMVNAGNGKSWITWEFF